MIGKMPNMAFRGMAYIGMPIRNLFMPPKKMLAEIDIETGHHILDFGCGPGIFSIMAAEKTGPSGAVYALDIHPLAVRMVEQKKLKKNLKNIETILSDCRAPIPDSSIDLVIFLDVFHMLDNHDEVLAELHRVLKEEGIMAFSDHHMKEGQILSKLNKNGLFRLNKKGNRVLEFSKAS
jgi:ubiquinone/menaquinone biosynthesis C-methylase UbiE